MIFANSVSPDIWPGLGAEWLGSFILSLYENQRIWVVNYYYQLIPFAGSGLVGYAIGFALKKMDTWPVL